MARNVKLLVLFTCVHGVITLACYGYLRVDRPQRSSAQHPTLYGFVPRTYCDERVRKLARGAKRGDRDPLDICVLSERAITRNEIIVRCRVIGGLQMIDGGEADDRIIGVLENDDVWGAARDVSDVPAVLVERLQHYFLTYKLVPGRRSQTRVGRLYGRRFALKVVSAAMADYNAVFPDTAAARPALAAGGARREHEAPRVKRGR